MMIITINQITHNLFDKHNVVVYFFIFIQNLYFFIFVKI